MKDWQSYPLTGDGMRELFADFFGDPSDLDRYEVVMLGVELEHELDRHNASSAVADEKSSAMRMYVADDKSTINYLQDGRLQSAFIRVSGPYFDDREAISFDSDGFIGFAGWADSNNVRPILTAFRSWVLTLCQGRVFDSAAEYAHKPANQSVFAEAC